MLMVGKCAATHNAIDMELASHRRGEHVGFCRCGTHVYGCCAQAQLSLFQ